MRHYTEYADRMYLEPMGPAHIVPWGTGLSLCNVRASELEWYGTGDWHETEHAAWLTLCPSCQKRAFPHEGEDPSVRDWREAMGSDA